MNGEPWLPWLLAGAETSFREVAVAKLTKMTTSLQGTRINPRRSYVYRENGVA